MATDVNELLDMLFDMVEEAKSVPLSGDRCMVERTEALDLIDEIRSAFPMELAEARKLIAARNDYLASAKREGDLIIQQAQERAKPRRAEDQIRAAAKREREEVRRDAELKARELKQAANRYCDDVMHRTEEALGEAFDEIKKKRARFRAAASGGDPSQSQGRMYDAEADQ